MSTVYKSHPDLEGFWSLDETAGTRYDKSINDNDLTDNNTVLSSTDRKENTRSADFELGNNEYLSITDGNQVGLDITDDITMCAWVKAESFAGNGVGNVIMGKYNPAGNQRSYFLLFYNNGATIEIDCPLSSNGIGFTEAIGATAFVINTWYHIAAVYNGTDIRIYVNGSLDNNGADNPKAYVAGIFNSTADFRIGEEGDGTWNFDGLIDEVAIFSYALSAEEIASIYESGIPNSPRGSMAENALFLY